MAERIGRLALDWTVRHLVADDFGARVGLQIALEFPGGFSSVIHRAPVVGGTSEDPQLTVIHDALTACYRTQGAEPALREHWMRALPYLFRDAEEQPELWLRL